MGSDYSLLAFPMIVRPSQSPALVIGSSNWTFINTNFSGNRPIAVLFPVTFTNFF